MYLYLYPHSPFWHYLWLAPHALQVVIAVAMVRRHLVHEFPLFLSYTVFQVVQGGVLFALDHSERVTGHFYWQAEFVALGIGVVLRFGVIWELFSHGFRSYPAIAELGRMLLRWGGVALLLAGVAIALYAPGANLQRLDFGIHVVDRTVSLTQTGLLVLLFVFSSYLGLAWRSYVFGIAVGMGIFSAVDLATLAIRVEMGPFPGDYVLDFITMAAYHICALIWLAYVLAPEPVRGTVERVPEHNLEQWNADLQRLLTR